MKKINMFQKAIILSLISYSSIASGQVGINSTGSNPHSSAGLDVDFNNLGVLIPRVALINTTSASPITSPATSLLVYNTATQNDVTPGYYYWDGTRWVRFATIANGASDAWTITGNAGTNPSTNFLGTTDAQDLVFKTSNTEYMRITSAGNVGIGTAGPGTKLDVVGDIRSSREIISTLGSGHGQFRAIGGAYGLILRNDGSDTYFLFTTSNDQYGSWNTLRPFIIENASGNVRLGNSTLFVQHNGNVGIGTTTPGEKLDVNGHLRLFNGQTDGARLIWRGGSGGTQEYRARMFSDGTLGFFPIEIGQPGYLGESLRLFQDGHVEVSDAGFPMGMKVFGTVEINHSYNSGSSRANHIYLTDPTNSNLKGYIGINRNTAGGVDKEYLSIEAVEESTHWMNIVLAAEGGNVGIGTTNPEAKLQINSDNNSEFLRMYKGSGNPLTITFGDNLGASNNTDGVVYFEIGGDETYVFGGHVVSDASSTRDLGESSKPWRYVYADDCFISNHGWVSLLFSSDVRYKKDIVPIKNVLPNLLKLEGVKYNWRKDEFPNKHFNDKRQIGFIAQEVEKIYPELVNTGKDGYKSINYGKFTPLLVEAIKEQQKIINELQKSNEELKTENLNVLNEVKYLKAEIEKIQKQLSLEDKAEK